MNQLKYAFLAVAVAALIHSPANASLESVPSGEARQIQEILEVIETQVRAEAEKNGYALRDAHAKQHGCVKANVNVLPRLAKSTQSSVFKPGAQYKAWIRYSNGSGQSQDDSKGDGHGMGA